MNCVTQWELTATCERISEVFLLPALEELLDGFPFVILGFHADNGSEYINRTVATLLSKLRVEFTKSRPRHSNDNALAETKNGAIVRKHLGYAHIPQHHAQAVNALCRDHLNPYVNFHRPCFFPVEITDAKGRIRKRYPYENLMTPYDKLRSLPKAEDFLKPGVTLATLQQEAHRLSDNQAAERLTVAKNETLPIHLPSAQGRRLMTPSHPDSRLIYGLELTGGNKRFHAALQQWGEKFRQGFDVAFIQRYQQ